MLKTLRVRLRSSEGTVVSGDCMLLMRDITFIHTRVFLPGDWVEETSSESGFLKKLAF